MAERGLSEGEEHETGSGQTETDCSILLLFNLASHETYPKNFGTSFLEFGDVTQQTS